MASDVIEVVDKALTSSISRVVAAFTPVLAGVIGAVLLWLQNVVGIDLQVDPAVAAAFVGSIILGACLVGLKWLEGRAAFEKSAAEIAQLHAIGSAQGGNDPIAPPGLQ